MPRRKPDPPPKPTILPVPADIDRAYVARRSKMASNHARTVIGGQFTPRTFEDRKGDALKFAACGRCKQRMGGNVTAPYCAACLVKFEEESRARVGPILDGRCNVVFFRKFSRDRNRPRGWARCATVTRRKDGTPIRCVTHPNGGAMEVPT